MSLVPKFVRWCRRGRRSLRSDAGLGSRFSLSSDDLAAAELLLVYHIQRRAFGADIEGLLAGGVDSPQTRKEARKLSPQLAPLCPFLDGQGLLRCGGRLARAEGLAYDEQFPLILPRGDTDVDALILMTHAEACHAEVEYVLGELRRRFWIVSGRQSVLADVDVLGCGIHRES